MDDLASSLGISKRTIYMNFRNKEDILKNCIHVHQEIIFQTMNEIMEQSENIVYGCLQIINHYKFTQLPTVKLWEDIFKYYPETIQCVQENVEKRNIYLRRLLNKGITENYFRGNINTDETICMMDISAGIKIRGIYSDRVSISQTDLIFSLMVNMLRGISTYKGIEIIDRYIDSLPNSNN